MPVGLILGTLGLTAVALAQGASSQTGPDKGAFGPAQAAADIVLQASGAEVAFLPAGMMFRNYQGNDLSKLFRFPGDSIVVSQLSGEQLMTALNRSMSLYPSPNSGFLQIGGMEVTFDAAEPAGERIVSVLIGGKPLETDKHYRVAMPISLARGGYGYFTAWDRKNIVHTMEGVSLESLLKGKGGDVKAPRWKSVG